MPRTSTIITIFLASPSDVSPERDLVAKAVRQWNNIHSQSKSAIFELIRWEDSVSAGFGSDGQDVINNQILPYDVLIAIFWTRLGTPTPRSVSGTSEEYEIALSRYQKGDNVEIAFYFKDSPIDPRKVDLSQVALVQEFEKRIQEDGAFSKRFSDEDALQFEINLLLDRMSSKFTNPEARDSALSVPKNLAPGSASSTLVDQPDTDEDDLGLFDIIEDLQKHGEDATQILLNMTGKLTELTAVVAETTAGLNDASAVKPLEPSEAKPFIAKVANKMNEYSSFIEDHLASYSENSFLMVNDVRKLIDVSSDFARISPDGLGNLLSLRENVESLIINATGANEGFLSMRQSTADLPRTTSHFNMAKRRFLSNTDALIDSNENIISVTQHSLQELDRIILDLKKRPPE